MKGSTAIYQSLFTCLFFSLPVSLYLSLCTSVCRSSEEEFRSQLRHSESLRYLFAQTTSGTNLSDYLSVWVLIDEATCLSAPPYPLLLTLTLVLFNAVLSDYLSVSLTCLPLCLSDLSLLPPHPPSNHSVFQNFSSSSTAAGLESF